MMVPSNVIGRQFSTRDDRIPGIHLFHFKSVYSTGWLNLLMLDLLINLEQTSCNAKSEDAEVLVP
jgi:hypothetical protein